VTVQGADLGSTTTVETTLPEAVEKLEAVASVTDDEVATCDQLVADNGYHTKQKLMDFAANGVRTHQGSRIAARKDGWVNSTRAMRLCERRRIRGARHQRLLRRGGELRERPNAHLYETGSMRRSHLRGRDKYSEAVDRERTGYWVLSSGRLKTF
jgi:transposase